MSSVTLDTLQSEFESACEGVFGKPLNSPSIRRLLLLNVPRVEAPGAMFMGYECHTLEFKRLLLALHVSEVAKDHGLQAAMLYKLSDGAIDPRKP